MAKNFFWSCAQIVRRYYAHTEKPKPTIHMRDTTKRSVLRSIHILFALSILGYIYGPPSETLQYLPYFRFIYFPVVALSGLWMWKGHVIRRLFSRDQ